MSIYVTLEFDFVLKNVKGLAEAIKLLQREGREWGDIRLECDTYRDGEIYHLELDDYNRHYDEGEFEKLYRIIAPFVEGHIYLHGEQDDDFAEYFDGKGNYESQESTKFYGFCSYEQFIKEHGKELPDGVKEKLEQWWIAKKV